MLSYLKRKKWEVIVGVAQTYFPSKVFVV